MTPAGLECHGLLRVAGQIFQGVTSLRDIVGVDEFEGGAAHHIGGLVTEHALHRGIHEKDAATGVEQAHDVAAVVDQGAIEGLAMAGRGWSAAHVRVGALQIGFHHLGASLGHRSQSESRASLAPFSRGDAGRVLRASAATIRIWKQRHFGTRSAPALR